MSTTSKSSFAKRFFYPGFNLGVRSRARIARHFLDEASIRTLDLGCGNGYFTFLAAARGGRALGVSFDTSAIARCEAMKTVFPNVASRVEFRVMDAKETAAMGERFEQVLMLEVLEHIDDDAEVLRCAACLLQPGGVLHITTPDVRLGKWVGTLDRHAQGGHCRIGYSAHRLEALVREAGLDVAYAGRVGNWGSYLDYFRGGLTRCLGGGLMVEGLVFLAVYPAYLLLKLLPIPEGCRIFHHVIARKPKHG